MRLLTPTPLNLEELAEIDIKEYEVVPVDASLMHFTDRTSVTIADRQMYIDPEGLKELGDFIGISSMYLKKLPEDLFAYTMNYFYRRAEGTVIELLLEEDTIFGVQLGDTVRLSLSDIVGLITNTIEDANFVEFERKNGNYKITIVNPENKVKEGIAGTTILLNDRLYWNPEFYSVIYNWGTMIKLGKHIEADLGKNITYEKAIELIQESLNFVSLATLPLVENAIHKGEHYTLNDPLSIIQKMMHEYGMQRHANRLLNMTSIDNTPISAWQASTIIANLYQNERLTKQQKKKVEELAGSILVKLPTDHRCEVCLSHVEDEA